MELKTTNNFLDKIKMKGFDKTATLILVALVMTACNKEETAVNNEDIAVRFSVQIGKQTGEISAQTRASGATWTTNDGIGVYAFENGTTTLALNMENKKYTADEAGASPKFSPEDGTDIYFPVDVTEKIDFMAYYPYRNDVTNYIYRVNVSDQSKAQDIDLLYANTADTEAGGYDKENSEVALVFYHKLAKFTLVTEAGKGLTTADMLGMTVTIKGMNTRADFNLESAELNNATSPADLTPLTIKNGEKYESIVLPAQSFTEGEWSVEFVVNGDTYVWKVPATELEEGKEYIWEIRVQKTPVLISGKIEDWVRVNGTGDAW